MNKEPSIKTRKNRCFFLFYLFLFLLNPVLTFAEPPSLSQPTLNLTDNEKAWLLSHPSIRVGMDSEYAPYEWLNKNGTFVGMAVDYLRLLEQKLGVTFEIMKGKSWSELVDLAKKGDIDVLTSIVKTPERLKYFSFSEPYRDTQTMIVDNGEGQFIGSLDRLSKKRVAVEKGYFTQEMLATKYPNIHLILANNILEALTFVMEGQADAYVGDMSAINYAIKNNGLEKLRISGQTEFSSQHRFAFPKSHTELASIMTKAMASISKEESDTIFNRWIGMRIEQGIQAKTILQYSVGIIFLFILFAYWYYRLRREVKNREAAERRERHRNDILEMIAKMLPLPTILESIVKNVEEQNPKMLCSILLLDSEGKSFSQVIAPSLPAFYNDAVKGLCIGQSVGSCGSAAYLKKRVIAENIDTHPSWQPYKALALQAGLKSCWSEPIFSSTGDVLGTFAIYHTCALAPVKTDISVIEQSANLTSIAIEKSIVTTKLKESEELYRHLTEEVRDVIWRADKDLNITYISPADERLRGYKASEVIGRSVFEMFTPEGVKIIIEKLKQRQEEESRGIYNEFVAFEMEHRCKDGRLLWGEIISKPERNEKGEIIGYHGVTREITSRKIMQANVEQLAFYDALTKLPNRLLLSERLTLSMASSKRSNKYCALLFLDLDNFKSLNDTYGHSMGDVLLVEVASRLIGCIREIDTVSRFGGDEFVIILQDLAEDRNHVKHQVKSIAETIRISLSEPYRLRHTLSETKSTIIEHYCTTSIGIALFKSDNDSKDELLKKADQAMYKAKSAGKNTIQFYEKDALF